MRIFPQRLFSTGPLHGVRVLDMTRILAGPYCTMILGDMGAEVIKIEEPTRGDDTRSWTPPSHTHGETSISAYFLAVNRNKKSVTVNLKTKEGIDIIHKLTAKSDVFIHNYVPSKFTQIGREFGMEGALDYETLRKINKRLIYVSISGYGPTGPFKDKPGYDVIVEAEAGLMSITGDQDGNPVKVGVAITDLSTGLYAHGAILASLFARERSGEGQKIDASLIETQVASLANIASNVLISNQPGNNPVKAQRYGTAHASIVPYQLFQTRNGGIVIGAGNDKQFKLLSGILDNPQWAEDERFANNKSRVKHRKLLVDLIETELKKADSEDWLRRFEGVDIPVGQLNTVEQTVRHPQVVARDMIQTVEHPVYGKIALVGPPVKYSKNKPSIRTAPPLLGEHTQQVLSELLEYSTTEIQELRDKKVIR